MARRKTVQPDPPPGSFRLPDGTLVIVDDGNYKEIGRGMHNRYRYEAKRDPILEKVAEDCFVNEKGQDIRRDKGDMRSGTLFIRQVKAWGLAKDISTVVIRKKIFPYVKNELNVAESALLEARGITRHRL